MAMSPHFRSHLLAEAIDGPHRAAFRRRPTTFRPAAYAIFLSLGVMALAASLW